jgi:hypothetical protein
MKAKPIFLIPFLLFIVSCTRVENKIVTYIAEVPFSTEYYRDFEFDILNDSAFIIKTLYLTPGSLSDESTHLRVSSGKIYKMQKMICQVKLFSFLKRVINFFYLIVGMLH